MEFKVFEDKSGAFVFTAPGSQETSDKFDRLADAFEEGQIPPKRMVSICETMIRQFPPLLRPYHILATIQLSKKKHVKALETAVRGIAAVHNMFPDDFAGPIPWHHDGNRPYLGLLKIVLLCYIAGKKYDKAAGCCQLLQRADPDDSCGARYVFGHVLMRAGEHEKAEAWFAAHGTEYSPYCYDWGLSLFQQERFVEAATAFRRGIAINPYIAEMIFHGHVPNPYPFMHFFANEIPTLAEQYLGVYGDIWDESREAHGFLYWLFNQSAVLAERARVMACRQQRSADPELPQPKEQVAQYQALIAAIDDVLSKEIIHHRPNGIGEAEWPWQVYQ